jgi:hypothetical protein
METFYQKSSSWSFASLSKIPIGRQGVVINRLDRDIWIDAFIQYQASSKGLNAGG